MTDPLDSQKRAAAGLAAELVESGMTVGLGTGSTVAHLLPAIARRRLDIRCVSTSPRTEEAARSLGLSVESFDLVDSIDLAIDGADQVAPDFWLVKGGGAAHTREKLVAASAARFVVIVDSSKTVERLRPPVPLRAGGLRLVEHSLTTGIRDTAGCRAKPRRGSDRRLHRRGRRTVGSRRTTVGNAGRGRARPFSSRSGQLRHSWRSRRGSVRGTAGATSA